MSPKKIIKEETTIENKDIDSEESSKEDKDKKDKEDKDKKDKEEERKKNIRVFLNKYLNKKKYTDMQIAVIKAKTNKKDQNTIEEWDIIFDKFLNERLG